ncbi:LISK family protein kinase [Tieghemostelium lacteum]|uniref:LISK family protein kinase n=1 Tax=Tieghemostelium lacteum TaxID=361077 RepID=A0A151Z350_TIELA|nr:LISK family protein kinase [Tieghemostelium lacteum]|eukprot:KYQ88380.1 LISK family protein kinase [Tieghemostelium lacteum]
MSQNTMTIDDCVDRDLSVKWVSNNHFKHQFVPGDKIVLVSYRGRKILGEVVEVSYKHPIRLYYKNNGHIFKASPADDVKYGYSHCQLLKDEQRKLQKLTESDAATYRADKLCEPSTKTVFKQKRSKQTKTVPRVRSSYTEETLTASDMSYFYNRVSYSHSVSSKKPTGFLTHTSSYPKQDSWAKVEKEDETEEDIFSELVLITDEEYEKMALYHANFKLYNQNKKYEQYEKELFEYVQSKQIKVNQRFMINDSKTKKLNNRYLKDFQNENQLEPLDITFRTSVPLLPVVNKINNNSKREDNVERQSQPPPQIVNSSSNRYSMKSRDYSDEDDRFDDDNDESNSSYYSEVNGDQYSNYESESYYSTNQYSVDDQNEGQRDYDSDDDDSDRFSSISALSYYSSTSSLSEERNKSYQRKWDKLETKYQEQIKEDNEFTSSYRSLRELHDMGLVQENEFLKRRVDLALKHFENKI